MPEISTGFSCWPDDVQLRPVTSMASGFLSQGANWFRFYSWIFVNPSTCWIDVGAHRIWQAVIVFWTALMFTNARFFSKLGFTDMMESTTKRRLCMSGLQVLRSQTWSVRWSSAQKFRKVNVYMSAALAEASSAAVASGANVERQTLGLRELFQPGHKGCLTTPGLTKPIRTPSWLLLRAALPMMNWSGSAPWVPMFRETAGIVTPKSTLFYSILECFETIGVPCPNWQFWSILGGQPLKASWHRLVFLLPLRC